MQGYSAEELRLAVVLAVFVSASGAIWIWVCLRCLRGKPIIPLARRRPVPWQGRDVLYLFLVSFLLSYAAVYTINRWVGPKTGQEKSAADPGYRVPARELAHQTEQLLRSGDRCGTVIAVTMAVFVAPLAEEFFFRVLLQGWLEAVWSRKRRKYRALRTGPLSWVPIVLPAAIFAWMHVRPGEPPLALPYLIGLHLGLMAAEILAVVLAVALLKFAVGATAADLGWQPEKLPIDAGLGLLALVAVIGPLLTMQIDLMEVVHRTGIHYAPDPIPLFPLALVFGGLYHRTHRIAPSLVLHMAFNATSVVLFFAGG